VVKMCNIESTLEVIRAVKHLSGNNYGVNVIFS
jgi:hypothetical protein